MYESHSAQSPAPSALSNAENTIILNSIEYYTKIESGGTIPLIPLHLPSAQPISPAYPHHKLPIRNASPHAHPQSRPPHNKYSSAFLASTLCGPMVLVGAFARKALIRRAESMGAEAAERLRTRCDHKTGDLASARQLQQSGFRFGLSTSGRRGGSDRTDFRSSDRKNCRVARRAATVLGEHRTSQKKKSRESKKALTKDPPAPNLGCA